MKSPPQLKTEMTPFPYSIDVHSSLERARAMMDEHDVRHLPVTEDQALVGVITEHDVDKRLAGGPRRGRAKQLTVRDVYVSDVYIVDLNEPLENVLLTMAERHIGSVIVTRKSKLAGVFTCTDACRSFGQHLRETFPRGGGNTAA